MRLSYNAYPGHQLAVPEREAFRLLHEMVHCLQGSRENSRYKRRIAACLAAVEEELLRNQIPPPEQLRDLLQAVSHSQELTSQATRLAGTLQLLSLTKRI